MDPGEPEERLAERIAASWRAASQSWWLLGLARKRVARKVCGCCGREYTPRQWRKLHWVGAEILGDGSRLDYRNCPCGTTLAVLHPRGL